MKALLSGRGRCCCAVMIGGTKGRTVSLLKLIFKGEQNALSRSLSKESIQGFTQRSCERSNFLIRIIL
jgi:hypothetical protein